MVTGSSYFNRPRLTVATIVARDGRFLIVEERDGVLNQPAGHVEFGESLLAAAVRECLEESAWRVAPRALLGVYASAQRDAHYVRIALICDAIEHTGSALDSDIVAAHWLTRDQILAHHLRPRSELTLRCIDDFLAGQRFPLAAVAL